MADAAAFFANKKKKKKAFKFNANKIDASTVTNIVHVDAPALSTDTDGIDASSSVPALTSLTVASNGDGGDGSADVHWDDEALAAATISRKATAAAPSSGTTRDWSEMKALDLKTTTGNEQDDIAEKLRVEETRAQLAAAREGMERQAQLNKEEKEKKQQEAKEKAASRFGTAAAGVSSSGLGGGGKWVPSRLRAGGLSSSDRFGGVGGSQKLDTEDENLFPDLASADKIIEKQKQELPAYKAPRKTPVGGGATWGARPKLNLKPKSEPTKTEDEKQQQESNPVEQSSPENVTKTAEQDGSEAASPPEAVAAAPASVQPISTAATAAAPAPDSAAASAPIKPKKKKKKDTATFGKK